MPQVILSAHERRLASFSRAFAVLYALAAIAFALAPGATFSSAGAEAPLFLPGALAAALSAALSAACAVTAARPRERRHAILPMVIANLVASALAIAQLVRGAGPAPRGAVPLLAIGLPLFLLSLFFHRGAAPGVHSAPAREGPQEQPGSKPVQLGVSKTS